MSPLVRGITVTICADFMPSARYGPAIISGTAAMGELSTRAEPFSGNNADFVSACLFVMRRSAILYFLL